MLNLSFLCSLAMEANRARMQAREMAEAHNPMMGHQLNIGIPQVSSTFYKLPKVLRDLLGQFPQPNRPMEDVNTTAATQNLRDLLQQQQNGVGPQNKPGKFSYDT